MAASVAAAEQAITALVADGRVVALAVVAMVAGLVAGLVVGLVAGFAWAHAAVVVWQVEAELAGPARPARRLLVGLV